MRLKCKDCNYLENSICVMFNKKMPKNDIACEEIIFELTPIEKEKLSIIIKRVLKSNPYPESVFHEPSDEDFKKFHKVLADSEHFNEDSGMAFQASMGRRIWNNVCEEFNKETEE